MQKTDNRLMEARYKVVAGYPSSPYTIGEIIEIRGIMRSENYDQYPAIFRKLEWWEDRTAEEMPEYVLNEKSGAIRHIQDWDAILSSDMSITEIDEIFAYSVPLTLEEYTSLNRK